MYRQYENPYKLQEQLEELKEEYHKAIEANEEEDTLINIAQNIAIMKERINFAWQDEEYDNY
jgi:vacuolar-type H+-ATPase subunit D/Vma8